MGRMWCWLLLVVTLPALAVDYPPVRPGRSVSLPADTGAHPGYRTEWWYVTGWLDDEAGVQRGFQITFFRVRTGIGEQSPGRFSPAQLILAHAAVADAAQGRLLHAERSARASGLLAGAATGRTHAWVGDWRLEERDGVFIAEVSAREFSYSLALEPSQPPMLNGRAGFSQKAPDPRHASYYYSRPQLAVSGEVTVDGKRHVVTGRAWLDQEWSSELMPEGARGWDWVGLNLDDGGALMAFRMRDGEGRALWSAGTLRTPGEPDRPLALSEVSFEVLERWRSPRTGAEYPVRLRVRAGGRVLELTALMPDQELDSRRSTGAVYWEGAVRVIEAGREIGRGYLEMTGYLETIRM